MFVLNLSGDIVVCLWLFVLVVEGMGGQCQVVVVYVVGDFFIYLCWQGDGLVGVFQFDFGYDQFGVVVEEFIDFLDLFVVFDQMLVFVDQFVDVQCKQCVGIVYWNWVVEFLLGVVDFV